MSLSFIRLEQQKRWLLPVQQCHSCGRCCRHIPMRQTPASIDEWFFNLLAASARQGASSGHFEGVNISLVAHRWRGTRPLTDIQADHFLSRNAARLREERHWGDEVVQMYFLWLISWTGGQTRHRTSEQPIYGPCPFLDGARCSIHLIKPNMCSGFPYYELRQNDEAVNRNPSYIRGCGFNMDADAGTDFQVDDCTEPMTWKRPCTRRHLEQILRLMPLPAVVRRAAEMKRVEVPRVPIAQFLRALNLPGDFYAEAAPN